MIFKKNTITSASILLLLSPIITLTARSEIYMTGEEAAKVFFPGQSFKIHNIELSNDDTNKIEKLSDEKIKSKIINLLVSGEGNVVFLDQVIGKHEQIYYAVAITKDARLKESKFLNTGSLMAIRYDAKTGASNLSAKIKVQH